MHASHFRSLLQAGLFADAPAAVLDLCEDGGRIFSANPGDVLPPAGARSAGLIVVLQGRVELREPDGAAARVADIGAGEILDEIPVVTGQAADTDAVAVLPCTLLELGRDTLRHIAAHWPVFDARLAQGAARRQRGLIFRRSMRALAAGLDAAELDAWLAQADEVLLPRGACLMRQGEPADAWYVLTSGRLAVTTGAAGHGAGQRRSADLLPGASVGEIGLLAGGLRSATVTAAREASLMRLSRAHFERHADAHPAFARTLMGTVVQRLLDQAAPQPARGAPVLMLLRASDAASLQAAFEQLGTALQHTARTALCTRQAFEAAVGRAIDTEALAAPSHPLWGRFDVWLAEAQRAHELVLLDAGAADDLWSHECLLHADRAVWLAEPLAAGADAPPPALCTRLLGAQRAAGNPPWQLLLVHPADTAQPRNTRAWLEAAAFDGVLHLRSDDAATHERAARLLAGKGHGLALSGGGARGLAHIGVIDAFKQLGVPIDCIGGTSMGAIQAAMHAMGLSLAETVALNRYVIGRKPFRELTLPLISLVGSRRRDACIQKSYGGYQIEDLWLPFLAVSTDLHSAQAVVHERGPLALAVAASASIPGLLVPVTDGARVLVDGGVVNNLPADLVKARCGGILFASKVAPSDDVRAPRGGFPSAWAVLAHRLLPWRRPLQTPSLGSLLMRTMTVGGEHHLQHVARHIDVLIEPDVDRYGMMQFEALPALIEAGASAARQVLAAWLAPHEAESTCPPQVDTLRRHARYDAGG
jgi:predicted acylesterase/phospholipase RssA/CRP-like cAMP-binding protein